MLVLELLSKKVQSIPNSIYVQSEMNSFTFREVDYASNYIANIIQEIECEIVPIYVKNDILTVPLLLGILKSGKIPLPISTDHDFELAKKNISDINYDKILTDIEDLPNTIYITKSVYQEKISFLQKKRNGKGCFIVSTSGSTGVPKKVLINEESLINVLIEYSNISEFSNESTFLNTSPYTFDASLFGFFLPLLKGGKTVFFENYGLDATLKVSKTGYVIKQLNVTHIFLVPSYAEILFRTNTKDIFNTLLNVTIGGEAFSSQLRELCKDNLNDKCQILNIYGPSETTIFSLYSVVDRSSSNDIPIGKPINGVLTILNPIGNDDNESFELLIGGSTLSNGYYDLKLNKGKFIIYDNIKYYKTGDIVELKQDGNFYYRGRRDNQVKVNGIRLELESIDHIALDSNMIKQSKTIFEKNKLHLFVKKYDEFKEYDIITYCKKHIRHQLNIIFLNEFPLTRHQKIDSKKLLKLLNENTFSKSTVGEEKSDTYFRIKDFLNSEFHVSQISDLDSLSSVLFFSEIETIFNIKIKDEEIYKYMQINELVKFIDNGNISQNISNDDFYIEQFNIKEFLQPISYQAGELTETLYVQKNYKIKKYDEILYFDIPMKEKSLSENYVDLRELINEISDKIDIFRLVLINQNNVPFFKYVYNFKPKIFFSSSFVNIDFLSELMFNYDGVPLTFINYNSTKNITRFYISHFLIDQFKLEKLAKMVSSLYFSNKPLPDQSFSYIKYIEYIKQRNKMFNLEEINKLIPESEKVLTDGLIDNRRNRKYLKINLDNKFKNADEFSLLTFYIFSKIIFFNTNVSKITASMISNITIYEGFDATHTIGDTHSTFPIFCLRGQDYINFCSNSMNVKKKYINGLNIRDIIFSDYFLENGCKNDLLQRWEKMNFSINFIGTTQQPINKLESLIKDDYGDKYLLSFVSNNYLYILLPDKVKIDKLPVFSNYDVELLNF